MDLWINRRGVLPRRIQPDRQDKLPSPGTLSVDALASLLPWRQQKTPSDAVVFVRLAVAAAEDAAAAAINRTRGRRETILMAAHGIPDGPNPIIAIEDSSGSPAAEYGRNLAARLGIEQESGEGKAKFVARIKAAAKLQGGRSASVEVNAFVLSLATWWTRNCVSEPNGRTSHTAARADRKRYRPVTFLEFTLAAWRDAGGTGDISRAVRTTLDTSRRSFE